MNFSEHTSGGPTDASGAVSISGRLASAETFAALYREGMGLVEETAAYLDGEGRRDAKLLKAPLTVIYATESMRLTTRLLELASWLLIRRALNEGEITAEEARIKRQKVKLRTLGRPSHIQNFDALPARLKALIEHSFRMTDRLTKLDQGLHQSATERAAAVSSQNPVGAQLERLAHAFKRA
jgi:regulator of CtrA degradation